MDDEYELMPHSVLGKLKDDLDNLKSKSVTSESDMHDSMNQLSSSKLLSEKIDPINDRLKRIEEQNEQIAEGLLSIADMIKNHKPKPQVPKPSFGDRNLGPSDLDSGFSNKPPIANDFDKPLGMSMPPPMPHSAPPSMSHSAPPPMPPMPPPPEKKKGFMGMFKK